MTAFLVSLLLRRVALPLALLLLGSLLTGGCGFHFGNKWGSRESLIRPLPWLDVRPQPKPKDDDDSQGGRRRPFRSEGPEADPSAPAPAADPAAIPSVDGSAAASDDDTIRYSSTGERLLNNAQEW